MIATPEWSGSALGAGGSSEDSDSRTFLHDATGEGVLGDQWFIPCVRRDDSIIFVGTRRLVVSDSNVFSHSTDLSIAWLLWGPERAVFQAYRERIEALRVNGEQDGYWVSSESELDFWRFIESNRGFRKGNLVLMDNGNLRAVWKDKKGTHLGLQFLGRGTVQYVIFKRRQATETISRVAGRDSLEGIRRQINAFDLQSLLCE